MQTTPTPKAVAATSEQQRRNTDVPSQPEQIALDRLQPILFAETCAAGSHNQAVEAITGVLSRSTNTIAAVYFERDNSGALIPSDADSLADLGPITEMDEQQWIARCEQACSQGRIAWCPVNNGQGCVIAAIPIQQLDGPCEAYCVVFPQGRQPPQGLVLLLQLAAAHISLWKFLQQFKDADSEVGSLAALLEILSKAEDAETIQHSAFTLVNEFQQFFQCDRVALGIVRGRSSQCQIQAISGISKFDKGSEYIRAVEAALDETIIREEVTVWPPDEDSDRHSAIAHRKLSEMAGGGCVVSSALRNRAGDVVGAWLFIGSGSFRHRTEVVPYIRTAELSVATSLKLLQDAKCGPLGRLVLLVRQRCRWSMMRLILGVAGVLLAALLIPRPYKISCDCTVEPVSRRFVAAPFDGTLSKTIVKPGDLVTSDTLLAQMDGREIRWELAGLEAEYNRARKEKDAAMASRKTAAAQIAKLQMEQLQLKIKVLEHRSQQLDIKSSMDGIVVAGDLERAEGAPLTVGQSLFEIAPLDQMIVEVEIPEYEIAHVREGMEVFVRVDAYPSQTWTGTLARIHPRSEIRKHESVFVADLEVENRDGTLRPGMNGQAKVIGTHRALGWILFHRPLDILAQTLGW